MASREFRHNRILLVCGAALTTFGLLHIPVWLFSATEWEGPVSWRKPILFGVSTGVTLLSISWLLKRMKSFRWDSVVANIVAITSVLEVLLITIQQWRGRESHFNRATTVDSIVDYSMMFLITLAFAGILYFLFRSFGELRMTPDFRLAHRAGMVFLVLSCVIGYVISYHGYQQLAAALEPGAVGTNGKTKFPHGIAIHALQILPLTAYVMRKTGFQVDSISSVLWGLSTSFLCLMLYAIFQTAAGLNRFEIQSVYAVLLLFAAGLTTALPTCKALSDRIWATNRTGLERGIRSKIHVAE